MAEKIIKYVGLSTGLDFYAVITRGVDGFILDATDMAFKAAATVGIDPAQPLTERAIDGVDTQIYEFTDATNVWNDGYYLLHIYERAGLAAAPDTDRIFASGIMKLYGDAIVERSYSFGDELIDPPVDRKVLIETATNDIIAALGTVVNSSFEGTATGGTNTTVEDTTAAWDTDIWASTVDIETLCIVESAATGKKYVVKINSNTDDTLTMDALSGGYVVVAGDLYTIIKNSSAVDIKSVGGTAQTGGDWTTQFSDIEDDVELLAPATAPTVYNVTIAAADTEYSQVLPANSKGFSISIINGTPGQNFRWAYVTGKVAVPTAPYRQIDQQFEYSKTGIRSTPTIYIAASNICVAQIEVWG